MKALFVFILLLSPMIAQAQNGSRVYFDQNDPFSQYFTTALEKEKVPVTVTTDRKRADYTVKFHGNKSNSSLLQGIARAIDGGNSDNGAYNHISLTVIDDRTQDVVYTYICTKYDQHPGSDSRMAGSIADCLAKHWKHKLRN